MTARRKKTGFDRFFDEQMKDPGFAAGYAEERAKIDAVDRVIRVLDEARLELGMSKAELARQISATPEIVRRLFTVKDPNPTLNTIARLAQVLGLRLELVPTRGTNRTRGQRARRAHGRGMAATAP
jgi:ribosome-binding protein aMBF1 (putative translation factor)